MGESEAIVDEGGLGAPQPTAYPSSSNFLLCTEIQPMNKAVMSQVDRKGTQHTYTCIHSPHKPPAHPGCHITLSRGPCAFAEGPC